MPKMHQLDLLTNSISYFREAVKYAQADTDDTNQWKFVIINLVQALELAFKEKLRTIHPAFTYDNIDSPKHSVSLPKALDRLTSAKIGGIVFRDGEAEKIASAVKLRNDLTHFEFNQPHDQVEMRFAEIFSFLIFFYRAHLGLTPTQFIEESQHWRIIQLVNARSELLLRAKEYLDTLADVEIWICPECQEATFVTGDEACVFCHHQEPIVDCPTCGQRTFNHDLIDTTDLMDWDYDEGRVIIMQDYGLEDHACPDCIAETRERVEQMRREQYDEDVAMEEFYTSR